MDRKRRAGGAAGDGDGGCSGCGQDVVHRSIPS
jgi:hypothetical protein